MSSNTPSERHSADLQRAAHLGRIADRTERIAALKTLLKEADKATVLAALAEQGYRFEGGFDQKDLPAIQDAMREAIAQMEGLNGEVAGLSTAIQRGLVQATKPDADAEASEARELSPQHQATLELLLGDRYQEGIDASLYTGASAPKSKVEAWLKADTARLDAAAKWEARGGKPMFVGEFEGEWVLAECSAEVPSDIRNICYGPNAAKQEGLSEDRNALTQAANLGGQLMSKALGERLERANLIKNANSWEWRAHPDNRDLEMDGDRVKDYGLAWRAGYGLVGQDYTRYRGARGGLRCALSGPKS